MMNMDKLNKKIVRANKKLLKAENELKKATSQNLGGLVMKERKQTVAKEQRNTFALLSQKLEAISEEYRTKAQTQYVLFAQNLEFKKHKEAYGVAINAVNAFTGFVNVNGHMYCEGGFTFKTKISRIILPVFAKYVYPKRIEGSINALGNISLTVTRYGWALFKTMPEDFTATISESGSIIITTQNRSSDFIFNNNSTIHKIISSFAFKSHEELDAFMSTKKELTKLIEQERKKL